MVCPTRLRSWRGRRNPVQPFADGRVPHGRCPAAETAEHLPDAGLHLLVGGHDDLTIGQPFITDGQAQRQFASFGFVQPRRLHLLAHDMPLRFRKGALDAQQQAVIVGAGIVDAAAVTDQNMVVGGQVEQLIPVGAVACQTGDIGDQEYADFAGAHVGEEALKAKPVTAADSRFAQVIVNDMDAGVWPAPGAGAGGQLVLQVLGFLVFGHLAQGGLADVDVAQR
jgi:hypothetical protein